MSSISLHLSTPFTTLVPEPLITTIFVATQTYITQVLSGNSHDITNHSEFVVVYALIVVHRPLHRPHLQL